MSRHTHVNLDTKKHCPSTIRFIETLFNESNAILVRYGESITDAKKMSQDFVVEVCGQLQGGVMYFGKNCALDTQMKHRTIKDCFNAGASIHQLAIKHSLSERQIYSIVFNKSDIDSAKASTTGAGLIAVIATRMMMNLGIEQDDAVSAARGLLAVIAAKLGGTTSYIASPHYVPGIIKQIEIAHYYRAGKSIAYLATHFEMSVAEISCIIKNYPAATLPDSRALPKIKTQLFTMASNFSGYPEVNTALEEARERINCAEEIIKKLEGAKL